MPWRWELGLFRSCRDAVPAGISDSQVRLVRCWRIKEFWLILTCRISTIGPLGESVCRTWARRVLILRPGIYARQKTRPRAIWTLTLCQLLEVLVGASSNVQLWEFEDSLKLLSLTYQPGCQATAHRHAPGRDSDPLTSSLEKGPLRRHICRAIMKSDRCRGETRRLQDASMPALHESASAI